MEAPSADEVESRWWYWIAAIPLASVIGYVLMVLVILTAAPAITTTGAELGAGFGVAFVALAAFGVFALVFGLMFPLAIYFDAQAIREADLDEWKPDPAFFAVLGVIGLAVAVVQLVVAVYYLTRRRQVVGVP